MNETMFLSELRSRLTAQGVVASEADKYAEQFKRYFDNLTEDEITEQITALGSMDGIVNNLLALIEAKRTKENINKNHTDEGDTPSAHKSDAAEIDKAEVQSADTENTISDSEVSADVPESEKDTNALSESEEPVYNNSSLIKNSENAAGDDEFIAAPESTKQDISSYEIAADEEISSLRANRAPRIIRGNTKVGLRSDSRASDMRSNAAVENDGFSTEAYNAAYNAAHGDDEYIIESETRTFDGTHRYLSTKKGRLPARGRKTEYYDEYDEYDDTYEDDRSDLRKYIYRGPKREWATIKSANGKKRFWGVLLGTLPITIPLAALLVILFSAAFLALWAIIAALVLLLAAITVVGSAFSLIAVIYGVTQLFSAVPVGMYEIGVGIASAGITMLAGILIYNADVRAMPYAIKYLIKFFFYCTDRLKGLVYRFREECAKIK